MAGSTTVEEYLAAQPDDRRTVLEALRRTIAAAAPDAIESIAYDMPAFRTPRGEFLVSFAAYKNHYSLFPASGAVVEGLGDDLAPYLAGKGTIRFPASRPISDALVTKIVRLRLVEVEARGGR
jgi:uncharacterized protein YdhG (YjbR/CyaY superfamily)